MGQGFHVRNGQRLFLLNAFISDRSLRLQFRLLLLVYLIADDRAGDGAKGASKDCSRCGAASATAECAESGAKCRSSAGANQCARSCIIWFSVRMHATRRQKGRCSHRYCQFVKLIHNHHLVRHYNLNPISKKINRRLISSLGARMGGVVGFFQAFGGDVRVNLCCRKVGVAEQFLDAAQIGPGIEQMRGVAVT